MTVSADIQNARAALGHLDQIADRLGDAFDGVEYDELAGARTFLIVWLEKNDPPRDAAV